MEKQVDTDNKIKTDRRSVVEMKGEKESEAGRDRWEGKTERAMDT